MSEVTKLRDADRISTRLAPYFLLRTGGMPINGLLAMRAADTMDKLYTLSSIQANLKAITPSLTERIEKEVPHLTDDRLRNKLITYKRDMYNHRRPKSRAVDFVGELPQALLAEMEQWEADMEKMQDLKAQAQADFNREQPHARRVLQTTVNNHNFLNGVLLTSGDLFEKVNKYIETPIEEQNARLRKVEYTLATMLTRVAAKTSPFSTFSLVGQGLLAQDADLAETEFPSLAHRSQVRINWTPVLRVLDGLLKHPDVRPLLAYRVNRTLRVEENRLVLIQRKDSPATRPRVFRTTETPVSMDFNPAMQMVIAIIRESEGGALLYPDLIERMSQAGPREAIEKFVNQLIDIQVIEPTVEYPEQSRDILATVRNLIGTWQTEVAVRTSDHLQAISALIEQYRTGTVPVRSELLVSIRRRFEEIGDIVGLPTTARSLGLLVYEDAILEGATRVPAAEWEEILSDLSFYQELAPLFDVKFRLQSVIAKMFVDRYGADGICTDTGEFVRNLIPVHTQFIKPMVPGQLFADLEIGNDIPNIRALNDLKLEFLDLINRRFDEGETEIELTREELAPLIGRVPASIKNRPLSHEFFMQWVKDDRQSLMVINQPYFGYLAFMSRFVEYFQEDGMVDRLRTYLSDLFAGTGALAEVSGVYGFNANLHPRIAPYEMTFPATSFARGEEEEVPTVDWRDVSFVYDRDTDRVMIQHEKIGRMNALYLGTLVPLMLPTIVRTLMNMFSNGNLIESYHTIREYELSDEVKQSQVRVYPRIRLGQVVVSRKKWMVPRAQLPMREAKESEFDYFCRVHEWRMNLNMPSRVFVRFVPMIDSENPLLGLLDRDSAQNAPELDFTEMKPQHIDFENPVLVRLLGKLIVDGTFGMVVEEMLPDVDQLPVQNGQERYVSEVIVEMSKGGVSPCGR